MLTNSNLLSSSSSAELEAEVDRILSFADEEVKERLEQLDQSLVEYRFDPSVRRVIRMYVEHWQYGSERILGRTTRYFPYFSEALAARNMPDAIKYLSITESALRPFAISHAGAAGLWQLMPGTARELGLTVNDEIDERFDLALGTEAGLQYLQIQYDRYEDWALAMAAYNSGPGRVNRAIRRSGSKNYWKLRRYLPRETRGYVPGFIAATYLVTYYSQHGLSPEEMDLDHQLTELIPVFRELSLHRVAMVTGLRPELVVELNPAYLAGYLPASKGGRLLRLPKRVVPAMLSYLEKYTAAEEEIPIYWNSPLLNQSELTSSQHYQELATVPSLEDTSHWQLAESLNVAPDQLLIWSGKTASDSLATTQWWTYYRINNFLTFGPPRIANPPPASPLPATPWKKPEPMVTMADLQTERWQTLRVVQPAKEGNALKRHIGNVFNWLKE